LSGSIRHAAIVSPDPASTTGGVERVCRLLADVLEQDGWRVTLVGPGRGITRWQFRLGAGYLGISHSATQAAVQLRPDLLITNGLLGMPLTRRIPRVHVFHGTMIADTRAEAQALSRREFLRRTVAGGVSEAVAGLGATVVCVSDSTAREVRRYYRLRTDAVIPNGVDTAVFQPRSRSEARQQLGLSPTARYCLFVGRLQHRKGSELLLPACRAAGFELLIAGARGAQGAHHLGALDPHALARAYSAADCVLFPTRYEACSLVVLEALAAGVPLLTTRVGWMPTLLRAVPEYEALCVRAEHGDIVARLRALGELDTPALATKARAWVAEHNSLERWAERWRVLLARTGGPA
jgi:glycosyltransferase involved in cell wall biosynthesis